LFVLTVQVAVLPLIVQETLLTGYHLVDAITGSISSATRAVVVAAVTVAGPPLLAIVKVKVGFITTLFPNVGLIENEGGAAFTVTLTLLIFVRPPASVAVMETV